MDNFVVKPLSVDTWTRSPVSSSGTTVCSAGVGAPGSTPSTPRRRSLRKATTRSRSSWSRRIGHTPPWRSTATRQSRGPSTALPAELPNIHHRKEYEETLDKLPDYRITCIFVDKKYRRKGVRAIALRGAIDLIAEAGGGVVEGYPHDTTDGKKVSVLYNTTRSLYEGAGFDLPPPQRQAELCDAQGRVLASLPRGEGREQGC